MILDSTDGWMKEIRYHPTGGGRGARVGLQLLFSVKNISLTRWIWVAFLPVIPKRRPEPTSPFSIRKPPEVEKYANELLLARVVSLRVHVRSISSCDL